MKNVRRLIFAALAAVTLTAAVWAVPVSVTNVKAHLALAAQGQKPQMMSGKISSYQKAGQGVLQDSFTLDITEDKTVAFFLVPQSKINGNGGMIKVGAQADVTYVFDQNGNMVAVTVNQK